MLRRAHAATIFTRTTMFATTIASPNRSAKLTCFKSLTLMTRMLFGIDSRRICETHPQLGRNASSWNRIDIARCVKQRLVTPHSPI